MAGGNGRVLDDGDDPRRPTARLAKDVWVLGADRAAPGHRGAAAAAGRPRVVGADARRRRAVLARPGRRAGRGDRQDGARRRVAPPARTRRWRRSTAGAGRAGWPHVLRGRPRRAARRRDAGRAADRRPRRASWPRRRRAVGERLDALLAEAATVGEYLSVTAGRVLGNLAASRDELRRRAGADRRARRGDRRPGRVRRAVGREHGARPGVALRRPRPAHRAGARRARPRRRLPAPGPADRVDRADGSRPRRRRPRRARGAAGGQREPRRLPPAPPQRRRAGPPRSTSCCTTSTTRARTLSSMRAAGRARRRRRLEPTAGGRSPSCRRSSTTTTPLDGVGVARERVEEFGHARRRHVVRHAVNPMVVRGRPR